MTKFSSTILGFGLAGVLGAAVAVLAMNVGSDEASDVKVDDSRGPAQLEQLSARLDRLADRLEILEKAPPMSPGQAIAPAAAIPSAAPADPLAAEPPPGDIDDRVLKVVQEREANRAKQMGSFFSGMMKQREAGVLDSLAEDQGLNDWQRTEMEKILEKRREVMGTFFRTMMSGGGEEPVDFTKLREEAERVRKETDEEIKNILTPDQYKVYEDSGLNRMRGPMGGGRGAGGGR